MILADQDEDEEVPTEPDLLFCLHGAGFAVKNGAVFAVDDFEAIRNRSGRHIVAFALVETDHASLAAVRAVHSFGPLIGHRGTLRQSADRRWSKLLTFEDTIKYGPRPPAGPGFRGIGGIQKCDRRDDPGRGSWAARP